MIPFNYNNIIIAVGIQRHIKLLLLSKLLIVVMGIARVYLRGCTHIYIYNTAENIIKHHNPLFHFINSLIHLPHIT